MWNNKETTKSCFPLCQTYKPIFFKLDFPKVGQNTGGKWLIHGTKRRKDNQVQSLELPYTISW